MQTFVTCTYTHVIIIMWGCGEKYLRRCWCGIWPRGCLVVFYVGVVDKTHGDGHGQELLQISPTSLLQPCTREWGGRVVESMYC